MNRLAPSILAADFKCLEKQIKEVQEAGASYLHFDVMDGMFVPNISFGAPVLRSIRPCSDIFIDVHLMVTEPIRYVEDFAKAGADLINVHYEACKDLRGTLEKIAQTGKKVGLTIKPDTPVQVVAPYLEMVDMVLVMCVYPGFGGQSFIEESLERIRDLQKLIRELGKPVDIEVDGGIKLSNVKNVLEAGANVIVVGSALFGPDAEANLKAFMEILNEN